MKTIPIQVTGDRWNNCDAVKELLDKTLPGDSVMLDLCSEGPSLRRLGIVDLLSRYNLDISVTRWSNSLESVPYKRVFCNDLSHFFSMSHHYWTDEIPNDPEADYRFALFQGRGCPSRNRILYDAYHEYKDHFLLSKMRCKSGDLWGTKNPAHQIQFESQDQWFDDAESVQPWFDDCPVTSIDGRIVQDQFVVPEISSAEMARSLFQHYPKFNIELICETYTLGETFFPTEKTIRPIVGNRPFLIYGPVNYISNLQQLGFQTFGHIWDETYDRFEGPQRWSAIKQTINQLINIPQSQWNEILQQCQTITQHNRNQVRKIIRDIKGI